MILLLALLVWAALAGFVWAIVHVGTRGDDR